MGFSSKNVDGKGTFPHGVHPPERKAFSEEAAIEVMPPPEKVILPLLQNIGAPSKSVVKAKQSVQMNDLLAEAGGFVSSNLHSPITGKVEKNVTVTLPNGRHVPALSIKADENQLSGQSLWDEILGGDWPTTGLDKYDSKTITDAVQQAGIVGLGGAAFPTHVKLIPNAKKPVDTLIINGCECEPFLTPDYRLMIETPEAIISGAILAAQAAGAKNIYIGVENNKPKAIAVLKKAALGTGITIAVLKTKYPQGSEKQLILAITKREVPLGALPLDVGVVVSNVGSATCIARAVLRNKPLTHRVISVTGGGVQTPKNVLAPIGISYGALIDFCGGLKSNAARIISGGPMMGFAFADLSAPVTKGTSGVTVLTHGDVEKETETACIRCGRCVDACPMNLVPSRLALASRNKELDLAERYNIMACFECGSCAYICPASLPIVQLVRMGKAQMMAQKKK
ncbi:MAG: electron transport complex subunit RsxC [Candidatus Magnetomorum sp.]|nr:electron transport complex subunit RsxC [Candidatus Magnetomorum sp.]